MTVKKTFRDLVDEAKTRITQTTSKVLASKFAQPGTARVIIDVRERDDFNAGHIAGALSIPRGRLELDIDEVAADPETEIVVYCGGGSRGALAADTLQIMGYENVSSLEGGYRDWASDPARPVET